MTFSKLNVFHSVAAYVETIRHSKKILLDAKRECLEDIDGIISNFKIDVSRRGRETAESVLSQESEDAAKKVLSDARERVELSAKDCEQKISDRIKRFTEQSDENSNTYESSTFVQQVQANIFSGLNAQGNSEFSQGGAVALGAGGAMAGAMIVQHGAQFAAPFAETAVNSMGHVVSGIARVGIGGELLAQGVPKPIAGFLGNEAGNLITKLPIFRAEPTMFNKIAGFFTNNAGIIGKVLGALGALFTIWNAIKGAEEERKRETEQRNAKNKIISGFNDIAEDIGRDLLESVRSFMTQNVEPIISAFDEKIKAVESFKTNEKIKSEKLSELLKRTENLIAEIQAN